MSHDRPQPGTATDAWASRLAAAVLIVGATAVRIASLASAGAPDLSPDEAHYWDWSRRLDWSYYSKGPVVAALIRLSCELFGPLSRALTGTELLAVRLPAVLCGALLAAGLYALTAEVYRRERLALAAVALTLVSPLFEVVSSLMTTDAPFLCCWGWALVFGFRALFRGARWAWPAAGLCVALGVMAKLTMLLWVPCLGLFLLATPAYRPLLGNGRFWLLAGLGALGGLPLLLWNLRHDWVTLRHEQGHAGLTEISGNCWLGPANFVVSQCAVWLGFWFVAWVRAAWAHRPGRERRPEVGYLWWMSLPVITFFLLFSARNGGTHPNWPAAGYVSGSVLTVGRLAGELSSPSRWYRRLTVACIVVFGAAGLGVAVLSNDTRPVQPLLARLVGPPTPERPTPLDRIDPTCRLRGWRALAAEVDRLRERCRAGGEEPVLAASCWDLPGEVGFYCAGHPDVYSLGPPLGDRHSQYDLWRPNPVADADAFRGRTFVVVGASGEALRPAFEVVEPTRLVVHAEGGRPVARWEVTVGRGFRGFGPVNVRERY